jgi:hypothetical protein
MGEGLRYHRGRRVPRSHLYDYGEEPITIGPRRPRRQGDAFGGGKPDDVPLLAALIGLPLALLGIAAFASLYGFIAYKLLIQ